MDIRPITIISGASILDKEMPAAFIERSSSLSPKFPNVIKEPSSIDNGRDNGINDIVE